MEREQFWRTVHARGYRQSDVWSVTRDGGCRDRLVRDLQAIPIREHLLLPGCGSLTLLQEEILARCPEVRSIACTDIPEAIAVARPALTHPLVTFDAVDSALVDRKWPEYFDVVMPVNSVVSDSDSENRAILRSLCAALRPRGWLLGIFPCIYALHEFYRYTGKERKETLLRQESLDLDQRSYTWFPDDPELPPAVPQTLYSVNDLRILFAEAGFDIASLQMTIDVIEESSHSAVRSWYGITDSRLCFWNFRIRVQKAC